MMEKMNYASNGSWLKKFIHKKRKQNLKNGRPFWISKQIKSA